MNDEQKWKMVPVELTDAMRSAVDHAESCDEAWAAMLAAAPAQPAQSGVEGLREALEDMLAGWKYIRGFHGDLYGVGWDRAQQKAEDALAADKPAQAAEPAQVGERATFEAWIAKDGGDLSTFGSGLHVHYSNSAVNNAWTGWNARAALNATPPAADTEERHRAELAVCQGIIKGLTAERDALLATRPAPAEDAEPVALTSEDVAEARALLARCSASAILSGGDDEARGAFDDRTAVYQMVCEANALLIGDIRPAAPLSEVRERILRAMREANEGGDQWLCAELAARDIGHPSPAPQPTDEDARDDEDPVTWRESIDKVARENAEDAERLDWMDANPYAVFPDSYGYLASNKDRRWQWHVSAGAPGAAPTLREAIDAARLASPIASGGTEGKS